MQPELQELERALRALAEDHALVSVGADTGQLHLRDLRLEQVAELLRTDAGAQLLMAAASMSRTDVKHGIAAVEAQLVAPPLRRAFVVHAKLPAAISLDTAVDLAMARRRGTVVRNENAATEQLFRDRLAFEGVPLRMQGAWTQGLLVERRKPDGVFPDPDTGDAPTVYLEVKKINRVADDIQKRLYEIAEVSFEVKFLYGDLRIDGLDLRQLLDADTRARAVGELRAQITRSRPKVVALLLCPHAQLDRAKSYRARAEAFVDRVFYADEIDECIAFLAAAVDDG